MSHPTIRRYIFSILEAFLNNRLKEKHAQNTYVVQNLGLLVIVSNHIKLMSDCLIFVLINDGLYRYT
jgi:hypothetical protein